MNGLILGDGLLSRQAAEYFTGKGIAAVVKAVDGLCRFTGQAGDFTAVFSDETVTADFVVLAQQADPSPFTVRGGVAQSVFCEDKLKWAEAKNGRAPVVFLLDYIGESSSGATIQALRDAKDLAAQKRQVYYLNRFVRTGGYGVEALYLAARNAGVHFIKYETIDIVFNDGQDHFSIDANDGVLAYHIDTKVIFAENGRDVGAEFRSLTKKLNLQTDSAGMICEDRHFLAPVFSSRRGVFHIGTDIALERPEEALQMILSSVGAEVAKTGGFSDNALTAEIDGEKCVLCYNCFRACPHAALEPDRLSRKMKNLKKACEGCGICVSVCPGNAVTLCETKSDESAKQSEQTAKAVLEQTVNTVSELTAKAATRHGNQQELTAKAVAGQGNQPESGRRNHPAKTLLLCCENSAAIAAQQLLGVEAQRSGSGSGLPGCASVNGALADQVVVRSVSCGGEIGLETLTEALTEYERVLIAVCMDDACRHFDGNRRACRQAERLAQMLKEANLKTEQIGYTKVSHAMPKVLRDSLIAFMGRENA